MSDPLPLGSRPQGCDLALPKGSHDLGSPSIGTRDTISKEKWKLVQKAT